jgi:hypothetical protein
VRVPVDAQYLALDWLDADAASGAARSLQQLGSQQRLVEQTADAELVARLLAEAGVDVDAAVRIAAPNGQATTYTPLTHAAGHGHLEAARLLLDAGADPSRGDADGDTPLMNAAMSGHLAVLRLLLGRG